MNLQLGKIEMRINLNYPFEEKDAAKALGARWDMAHLRSMLH